MSNPRDLEKIMNLLIVDDEDDLRENEELRAVLPTFFVGSSANEFEVN